MADKKRSRIQQRAREKMDQEKGRKIMDSFKEAAKKAPITTGAAVVAILTPLTWPIVIPAAVADMANKAGVFDKFKKKKGPRR